MDLSKICVLLDIPIFGIYTSITHFNLDLTTFNNLRVLSYRFFVIQDFLSYNSIDVAHSGLSRSVNVSLWSICKRNFISI